MKDIEEFGLVTYGQSIVELCCMHGNKSKAVVTQESICPRS